MMQENSENLGKLLFYIENDIFLDRVILRTSCKVGQPNV